MSRGSLWVFRLPVPRHFSAAGTAGLSVKYYIIPILFGCQIVDVSLFNHNELWNNSLPLMPAPGSNFRSENAFDINVQSVLQYIMDFCADICGEKQTPALFAGLGDIMRMQIADLHLLKRRALLFIACTAIAWTVFGLVVLALPAPDILKFFLFQLLGVAAPGLALAKLLGLRMRPLELLALSYGLGIAVIILLYFLFAPFYATRFLPAAVGAVAVLSLFALWRLRRRSLFNEPDDGGLGIGLGFCAIAVFMTAMVLSASMLNPSVSGPRNYFLDTLNGVNFVTSASRGYPMQTLEMAGVTQYYHIFLYSYAGVMKLCTGLASFEVMTKYTFITISPLLAAGVASLAKRVLGGRRATIFACVMVLLFPYLADAHYLYNDTIGFTLGLAFAVLCVLLFVRAQQEKKPFNRYFLLSALFLLLCLGAKGPVSVSVMFGLCFCLLVRLIQEKKPVVIAQGFSIALPYFLLYFLLYRNSSEDSMSFSAFYDAVKTPVYTALSGRIPDWLAKLAGAVYNTVWRDPLIVIAFAALLLWAIRSRHQERDDGFVLRTFCLGAIAEGMLMMNLFKQMGSSEVYFLTCLWPFAYIAGTRAVLELLRSSKRRRLSRVIAGILILPLLCVSVYDAITVYLGYHQPYLDTCLTASVKYSRFNDDWQINPDQRRSTVTPAEYEGLLWLRDNTPKNSVIADGRYLQNNKYFCNTAFSERAFFLGGYGFITMDDTNDYTPLKIERDTYLRFFYETGDENYLPRLAQEGCDYLIVCEFISPGLELSDRFVEEVFRNEEMKIYKFKEME